MENRAKNIIGKVDLPLLVLFLALVVAGLLTVYSASYSEESPQIYSLDKAYGKQLVWIIISLLIGVLILTLEGNFIRNSAYIVYGVVTIMLLIVLFMPAIKGAHSWFKIGGFTIQPSEFAKFSTSLAVAHFLSTTGVKIQETKTKLIVFFLIAVPGFFILQQPDPGTLLVFFSFIFVMYREGLSGNILLGLFFALIIGVMAIFFKASEANVNIFGWVFEANYLYLFVIVIAAVIIHFGITYLVMPRYRGKKYITNIVGGSMALLLVFSCNYAYDNVFKDRHRDRFEVMFGLKLDRKGVGYNSYQALSAIGSGGPAGKGYFKGTLSNDKYKHVPEQSTDFIFCSWAEEWGFLGSFLLIILYTAFLIRIIMVAERQKSKFTRIFGYCAASILFFHYMINIAMVIGLAPVIGIPLPFFSKGGSAILGFSIMIFILLRMDSERKDVLR